MQIQRYSNFYFLTIEISSQYTIQAIELIFHATVFFSHMNTCCMFKHSVQVHADFQHALSYKDERTKSFLLSEHFLQ